MRAPICTWYFDAEWFNASRSHPLSCAALPSVDWRTVRTTSPVHYFGRRGGICLLLGHAGMPPASAMNDRRPTDPPECGCNPVPGRAALKLIALDRRMAPVLRWSRLVSPLVSRALTILVGRTPPTNTTDYRMNMSRRILIGSSQARSNSSHRAGVSAKAHSPDPVACAFSQNCEGLRGR